MKVNQPIYSINMECRTSVCQAIYWALVTPIRSKFTDLKKLKGHERQSQKQNKKQVVKCNDFANELYTLDCLKSVSVNVSWRHKFELLIIIITIKIIKLTSIE